MVMSTTVAIQEREKSVIFDALRSFKNAVTKSHLTSLSELPRNGKAASTVSSEAVETKLVDRLQSIDRILERLTATPVSDDVRPSAPSDLVPHTPTAVLHVIDADEEPYVNPFTGLWVVPPSADAPGPSEIRSTTQTSPSSMPSTSLLDLGKNEYYKNAIGSSVAATTMYTKLGEPISSMPDLVMKKASALDNALVGVTSYTTSYEEDSQLGVRMKDLSSILSEFDGYFSSVQNTQQSSRSSFPQATSPNSAINPSVALRKETLQQAGRDRCENGTHCKPLHSSVEESPTAPSIAVGKTSANPRIRWQQRLEEDRIVASALLEQDHAEMAKINADYQLALELAEGFPQDFDGFSNLQSSVIERQLQDLRDIEQEFSRQDQEAQASETARLQAIEDDWNRSYQESIQAEQTRAQQIAEQEAQKDTARILEELRLLQDQLQAEEDGQIAADRAFALSLSQDADSAITIRQSTDKTPHSTHLELPPPYVEQDMARFDSSFSANQLHDSVQPALAQPVVNRVVHDFDRDFQLAQQLRDQWQADLQAEQDRNTQAIKAAQQEIESREAQSRQDLEFARSEDRRQRQERENQRQQEVKMRWEEERKRKAEMVDCTVCSEEYHRSVTYRFPCTHAYCRDCLAQAVQTKVNEKSVFRCCKNRIDMSQATQILSTALANEYGNLVQELDTPHPIYCSRSNCSRFIPPTSIKAGIATCPQCQTSTCASCKKAHHLGVCKEDRDGQALLKLGSSKGWKSCPKCGTMVERRAGCLHMTCRCGQQFCYSCAKSWSTCQATCKR